MNINRLEKGDIILCANICSSVIIDIFIPGTYHHVFIYTGNGMCIDFLNHQLKYIPLKYSIDRRKYIKIIRHIDKIEAYLAVDRAFKALNKGLKYSIFDFNRNKYCFSFVNYCYNYVFEKSKIYNYILASSILNHPHFINVK